MLTPVLRQALFAFTGGAITVPHNLNTRVTSDLAAALASDQPMRLPRRLTGVTDILAIARSGAAAVTAVSNFEARLRRIPRTGRDFNPELLEADNSEAKDDERPKPTVAGVPLGDFRAAKLNAESAAVETLYQYVMTNGASFARFGVVSVASDLAKEREVYHEGAEDFVTKTIGGFFRHCFDKATSQFSRSGQGNDLTQVKHFIPSSLRVRANTSEAVTFFGVKPGAASLPEFPLHASVELARDYEFIRSLEGFHLNAGAIHGEGEALLSTGEFRDAKRLGALLTLARMLGWYSIVPSLFYDMLLTRLLAHPAAAAAMERLRARMDTALLDFDYYSSITQQFHKLPPLLAHSLEAYTPFTAVAPDVAQKTPFTAIPVPMAFASAFSTAKGAAAPKLTDLAEKGTAYTGSSQLLSLENLLVSPAPAAGATELTFASLIENRRRLARYLEPITRAKDGFEASAMRAYTLVSSTVSKWRAPGGTPRLSEAAVNLTPVVGDGALTSVRVASLADYQTATMVEMSRSFGPAEIVQLATVRGLPSMLYTLSPAGGVAADAAVTDRVDALLPTATDSRDVLSPLAPVDPARYIFVPAGTGSEELAQQPRGRLGDDVITFPNEAASWQDELGLSAKELKDFILANPERWAHLVDTNMNFGRGMAFRSSVTEARATRVVVRFPVMSPPFIALTEGDRLRAIAPRATTSTQFFVHPLRDELLYSVSDALAADLARAGLSAT